VRDEQAPAWDQDRVDRSILVLLLDRERPWPCSVDELHRELDHDPAAGLARLNRAGLVILFGGFVCPARAASEPTSCSSEIGDGGPRAGTSRSSHAVGVR